MESQDINPHKHGHMVFEKDGGGGRSLRKDSLLTSIDGEMISTYRIMKLGPYLSPCTNINSKYMKSDQAFWNFVAKSKDLQ